MTNPPAQQPMQKAFSDKQLAITFHIINQDGSTDSLTLDAGYRTYATISHVGMNIGSHLTLTIEGMTPHDMNRLSCVANASHIDNPTLRTPSASTVELRAGSDTHILSLVFIGDISESFASFKDGASMFHLRASTISALSSSITPPISYRGSVSVPSLLSDICTSAGFSFVDHGGWETCPNLTNPYESGTTLTKINRLIRAVRGTYHFVRLQEKSPLGGHPTPFGVVHAWGSRYSGMAQAVDPHTLPFIAPETGLIGTPHYSSVGLTAECLFRSDVSFYNPISLYSSQLPTGWAANSVPGGNQQNQHISPSFALWNGVWLPLFVRHTLSSEVPNGPWMTFFQCQRTPSRPISGNPNALLPT